MKKILLLIAATIMLTMGFPADAEANPAYQGIKKYVQPDRTVIEYRLLGDEHFNWRETPEGDVILLDKASNYYCYSQFKNNKITKTDARVGVDNKPFVRLTRKSLLSLADYSIRNHVKISGLNAVPIQPDQTVSYSSMVGSFAAKSGLSLSPATFAGASTAASSLGGGLPYMPPILEPKQNILVVLVEFQDMQMAQTDQFWSEAIFGDEGKSLNRYYQEVSRGALSFVPVPEIYENDDVEGVADDGVVRVRLNMNHPAAAAFTPTDVMMNSIKNAAIDAVEAAAPSVTNLQAYDTNGNGTVESTELHVITIFAGYEMSGASVDKYAIWAHYWSNGAFGTGDLGAGLRVEGYVAVGENLEPGIPSTIGLFCHEMGHSLGLPDLYDYGDDSMGLGPHSLMALGSWGAMHSEQPGATPVHLDAWSKIQLGFTAPTTLISNGSYWVNTQSTSEYNVLKIGGTMPEQYFLVERRSLTGFDAGLAAFYIEPGVAIYHIDETALSYGLANMDGLINENEYRKAVDLEEANMGILGYSEMDAKSQLWDGRHYFTPQAGWNLFNAATNPASGLYDKAIVSPFDAIAANGTQGVLSGVSLTVLSATSTNSEIEITVPAPALHAAAVSNQTYTGSPITPAVLVHDGNEYLQAGVDYQATYRNNLLPGKATIDLTGLGDHAGLTTSVSFVIVPKPLTSLTVQLNEKYSVVGNRYRTIKATWPAVTGASGYHVAYRASTSGAWSADVVAGTSWTRTLNAGTLYYVRVIPYVVTDGTKRNYSTSYSPQQYVYTLKAPAIALAKYGTRSVKVSLGSVLGETGYDVLRATSLYGTYYHKAYVKADSTYWIDTTTYVGRTYYYKVRTYKVVNGVVIFGPTSTVKYIRR